MAETLNDQQERFCLEYIGDLNGKQAAIRAGYSLKTAEVKGSQLLSLIKVQHRVSELKQERCERTEITADFVLKKIHDLLELDPTVVLSLSIEQLKELPIEYRRMITGFKEFEGTETTSAWCEVKFMDKNKALEMGAKHTGIYEKDNDQKRQTLQMNSQIVFIDGTESD